MAGSLLIGNETVYTQNGSDSEDAEEGYRLECVESGTLEEFFIETSSTASACTSWFACIWEDSSGKPGKLLAEVKVSGKPAASTLQKVTGFSLKLTKGTHYWLGILPVAGNFHYWRNSANTGEEYESTGTKTTPASTFPAGSAAKEGPPTLYGTGTVSETKYEGPAVVRGAGHTANAGSKIGQLAEAVARAASRVLNAGAKTAENTGLVRTAARLEAVAGRLYAGTAYLNAGAHNEAAGAKTAENTAAEHAAAHLTASSGKQESGEATVRAGAHNTASASKVASSEALEHTAAHNTATASKTATGTAVLRAGAEIIGVPVGPPEEEEPPEIQELAEGEASLRTAAHTANAGTKLTANTGTVRAAGETRAAASKTATNTGYTNTAAHNTAVAGKQYETTATTTAAIHNTATASKTANSQASIHTAGFCLGGLGCGGCECGCAVYGGVALGFAFE